MDLNAIWLADASFWLNSALLGAVCGFMCRPIQRKFGVVTAGVVLGLGLAGIISMTSLARGVVHDALVAQAATAQVESAEPINLSTDTFSSNPEYHRF